MSFFFLDRIQEGMETPRTVENRWKSCDFSGLTASAERYSFNKFRGRPKLCKEFRFSQEDRAD
jgi:hypothetical protein